jgi:hypothetical protein
MCSGSTTLGIVGEKVEKCRIEFLKRRFSNFGLFEENCGFAD